MEYVIFTESDKFKGYIDVKKLLYQIKGKEGEEIVSNINKYKAEKNFEGLRNSIKGIVTYFIIKDSSSNKRALEVIKKLKKPSLAVVDKEGSLGASQS